MSSIRTAASLIVCRLSAGSTPDFSVLLLKRSPHGAFGGLTVFPGGAISPSDFDPLWTRSTSHSTIPSPISKVGSHLAIAALRETFEESGVYITHNPPDSSILQDWRGRVYNDASQFRVMANQLNAYPALSRLVYWANWITPTTMPKRFDTHFFMTVVDQECGWGGRVAADGDETITAEWMTPTHALSLFEQKKITTLPPQFIMLKELSTMSFSQLKGMVDSAHTYLRPIKPILPEYIGKSGQGDVVMALPGDERHSTSSPGWTGKRRITLVKENGLVTGLKLEESTTTGLKL
ncbi:hypothetical protein QVD99_000216 [Batrachochytrium dendrobatidis]|nr:hypothetical protein QVD99_000216 [Batrachochytrium dendrobatidis]